MKLTIQCFAKPGGRFLREAVLFDDDVPAYADGHHAPLTDEDPVPDVDALPAACFADIPAVDIMLVQAGRMRCLVFADDQNTPCHDSDAAPGQPAVSGAG